MSFQNKKIDVSVYYFPNYHADVRNEKWHGRGWNEWDLVKCARPRFEGHDQPKEPLWGYEDESDPKVMAKKLRQRVKAESIILYLIGIGTMTARILKKR